MTEMRTPVIKPFLLDFGLVSTAQRVTSTFQVHPPSDAEVTAVMVQHDTGSFKVQQVIAYHVMKEPVDPSVPGAPANSKDRLTRFGQEFLETLFACFDVALTVLEPGAEKTPEQELTDDLLALIASFSGRLYGMRSHKQKELLQCAQAVLTSP